MFIAILGKGLSGKAAAALAEKIGCNCAMLDEDSDYAAIWPQADLIVTSPGIKLHSPMWRSAVNSGKQIIGEMEFAFRHWQPRIAAGNAGRILAITGTDGKTTTTELTVHLLRALGVNAMPAGNIGVPLSTLAAEYRGNSQNDVVPVVEVSSFQLETVDTFAPYAAALLNVGNDHLDRYPGGMADYEAVKRRIFHGVAPENRIFGLSMQEKNWQPRFTVAGNMIQFRGRDLFDFAEAQIKGTHNLENLLCALELVGRMVDETEIFSEKLAEGIRSFSLSRHRVEEVGVFNGVLCVNDSKATNPHAAAASIGQYERIILLAGGLDKGLDFSLLNAFSSRIKHVFAYGECRAKIMAAVAGHIPCTDCGMDFPQTVSAAMSIAKPGDTVLLAPCCASMDMFKNYQERGDMFCRLVSACK